MTTLLGAAGGWRMALLTGAAVLGGASCSDDPSAEGRDRSEAYRTCTAHLGFAAGTVVAVISDGGAPIEFDTEIEVPAEVHRPCLATLTGGATNDGTSWGRPDDVDRVQLASNTYSVCLWLRGFDAGGVQAVFLEGDDEPPTLMKTGVDVPAEFHGPCFAELTGRAPTGQSSWG